MSNWQPIETCNEDGGLTKHMLVAVMNKDGECFIGWVEDWAGKMVICDNERMPLNISSNSDFAFWMPLPKPPKK
jgi:hypothetical protein